MGCWLAEVRNVQSMSVRTRCENEKREQGKVYERVLPSALLSGETSFEGSRFSVVAAGVVVGVSGTSSTTCSSVSGTFSASDRRGTAVASPFSTDVRESSVQERTRLKGCLKMRCCP